MRYALDVRVRNAAIAEGLIRHGCTQAELAKLVGISYVTLNSLATLRRGAWMPDGSGLTPAAKKVAEFLGCSDAECFPPELYAHFVRLRSSRALIFREANLLPLSEVRLLADTAMNQEEQVSRGELSKAAKGVLSTLPEIQRRVIERRFGLDGNEEQTLHDIGKEFGVSSTRIYQIEARALRHLRHPSRSRKLLAFLNGSNV